MATDRFSEWWRNLHFNPEKTDRAGLGRFCFQAGRDQERTEIRQALIAEAARMEPHYLEETTEALRTFAAGLIGLKEGES